MFNPALLAPVIMSMVLSTTSLGAPHTPASYGETVTIIVKESFPDTALQAIVVRSRGKASHDVIAIRRDALSAELLSAALVALKRARLRYGSEPRGKVSIRFLRNQKLSPMPMGDRARIEAIISQLVSVAPQRVPRIKGVVQIAEVPFL